jgi:hypothetical protein
MRAWGVTAFAALAACYSLSAMQEPRPLPQGGVRPAVGLGIDSKRGGPSLQLGTRVGLGAGTEVRLKLVLPGERALISGTEAGLNWQPWDSERIGIFLMPHYRYYRVNEDDDGPFDEYCCQERTIQAFAMPSLVVFHLQPYDLFVGPDVHAGTRQRHGFLALGGHLGASVRAGRFVHLTLEGGLLGSVAGPRRQANDNDGVTQSILTVGALTAELGFSVSLGSTYLK